MFSIAIFTASSTLILTELVPGPGSCAAPDVTGAGRAGGGWTGCPWTGTVRLCSKADTRLPEPDSTKVIAASRKTREDARFC